MLLCQASAVAARSSGAARRRPACEALLARQTRVHAGSGAGPLGRSSALQQARCEQRKRCQRCRPACAGPAPPAPPGLHRTCCSATQPPSSSCRASVLAQSLFLLLDGMAPVLHGGRCMHLLWAARRAVKTRVRATAALSSRAQAFRPLPMCTCCLLQHACCAQKQSPGVGQVLSCMLRIRVLVSSSHMYMHVQHGGRMPQSHALVLQNRTCILSRACCQGATEERLAPPSRPVGKRAVPPSKRRNAECRPCCLSGDRNPRSVLPAEPPDDDVARRDGTFGGVDAAGDKAAAAAAAGAAWAWAESPRASWRRSHGMACVVFAAAEGGMEGGAQERVCVTAAGVARAEPRTAATAASSCCRCSLVRPRPLEAQATVSSSWLAMYEIVARKCSRSPQVNGAESAAAAAAPGSCTRAAVGGSVLAEECAACICWWV